VAAVLGPVPFCYLHAADLHLDTPFEGLAVTDPALRERLVDASLEALDALVDAAIREEVSFVVLAGDVYDGASRGLRAQLRLLTKVRELDRAGIWTFIAHGNHDPVGPGEGWTAIRAWPERVHVFPADRVSTVALTARDGTAVTVSGISYAARAVYEPLHRRFPRPAEPGFHLAVLHADVGQSGQHAPYSPCRVEDLVGLGYHAWALGHIHQRQILRPSDPFVAYPGNLQGRTLRETGPKGALIVEVDGARVAPRFVELAPVRFEVIDVDVSGCDDLAQAVDLLTEGARARAAPLVARAVLTGRSALLTDALRKHPPEALLRTLQDAAPQGVAWVDLALKVRPLLDLDALRDRQDLHGELARTWAALGDGDLAELLPADRYGEWTDEERRALRDEAAYLAFTVLGAEG
jgi:DNA repair exonuclease SbcCD nuclease subunit